MSALTQPIETASPEIFYPESDGLPMADNTRQFEWIVTIKENLDGLLPGDFVAGNIFWYPVEGDTTIKQAPDVLVALGRPKGERSSYKQWEEASIAPQVVFEILSPGNTYMEMQDKEAFYEGYGVEEYYIYNPHKNVLWGRHRVNGRFEIIHTMQGWVSPRLGIRFERTAETLEIYQPNGDRFLTVQELRAENIEMKARTTEALALAERESTERKAAEARAEQERVEKEAAQAQARLLAEKLRELGIDPDTFQKAE